MYASLIAIPYRNLMAAKTGEQQVSVYFEFEEMTFDKDASGIYRSKASSMFITECDRGKVYQTHY